MIARVVRVVLGVESVVGVDAGSKREKTHDGAIGAMNVESGVVTVGINGDAETLLDLVEGENIGYGVWAKPHSAEVGDVPHLYGCVSAAIGVNDVGVRTGPDIREERGVAKNVG